VSQGNTLLDLLPNLVSTLTLGSNYDYSLYHFQGSI
jgi:hypothetical protein